MCISEKSEILERLNENESKWQDTAKQDDSTVTHQTTKMEESECGTKPRPHKPTHWHRQDSNWNGADNIILLEAKCEALHWHWHRMYVLSDDTEVCTTFVMSLLRQRMLSLLFSRLDLFDISTYLYVYDIYYWTCSEGSASAYIYILNVHLFVSIPTMH